MRCAVAIGVAAMQSATWAGQAASQIAMTPAHGEHRSSFRVSLVAAPHGTRTVALHWNADRGANRYFVLRAPRVAGPWINVSPEGVRDTSFETRGIPGTPMVFRVVADRPGNRGDTTGAAFTTIPERAQPERVAGALGAQASQAMHLIDCRATSPASIRAAWTRDPDADRYEIGLSSGSGPSRSVVIVRTNDTIFVRSGIQAGPAVVRVTPLLALADFPALGDTAWYAAGARSIRSSVVTFPIVGAHQCQ